MFNIQQILVALKRLLVITYIIIEYNASTHLLLEGPVTCLTFYITLVSPCYYDYKYHFFKYIFNQIVLPKMLS